MKRLLLGSLLAALVMFIWGFLFWAVPWPNPAIHTMGADAEAAVAEALRRQIPETGTYVIPNPQTTDPQTYTARHEAGPVAMLFVQADGFAPMRPGVFVGGFVHMLAVAFLLGLILRIAAPVAPTYGKRVLFVLLLGLTAALWSEIGEPIWWAHPWAYHLTVFVSDVTTWGLAGLILARFATSPSRTYA
jgi:hypothetical protein